MSETTIPTSEVLYRAADLIEERGWGQGVSTWHVGGALCLEGGIIAATGRAQMIGDTDMTECPAYMAVHRYLFNDDRVEGTHRAFAEWNDAPDRTASEVIEVLRACAVIEAARESKENAETRQVVSA